jgi:hypothetical protein
MSPSMQAAVQALLHSSVKQDSTHHSNRCSVGLGGGGERRLEAAQGGGATAGQGAVKGHTIGCATVEVGLQVLCRRVGSPCSVGGRPPPRKP